MRTAEDLREIAANLLTTANRLEAELPGATLGRMASVFTVVQDGEDVGIVDLRTGQLHIDSGYEA